MANNNIKNINFLRNGIIVGAKEAAISAMQEQLNNTDALDGSLILGRYSGTTSGVTYYNTLAGLVFNDGTNKSLTIIDIEGISDEIDSIIEQVESLLGNGISTANTVSDQLAALSGNTAATSADTSVAGAKVYTDNKIDEEIGNLNYRETPTGNVITSVLEEDGIIAVESDNVGELELTGYEKGSDSGAVAATDTINEGLSKLENQIDAEETARIAAIEALDVTDEASAKSFVIKVDETDGVISTTKGTVTSDDKTVTLTDNADGGVDFSVNVDGETLIVNTGTGVISVASAALVQYEGDDNTIEIGEVSEGVRTVSSLLEIKRVATGLSEEVKEEYHLIGSNGITIGDPVKIYKDSHIVEINYITDTGDTHYQNLEYVYIDASGETQTEYVDISMLVLEAEFASGLTIENHVARGVVDPTSEDFLTVGAGGFKLDGVQNAIDTAISGLDSSVSAETAHITVQIDEVDGELTSVTLNEDDIASASGLTELSGKTITAITSTNNSITATIDEAVGNKSYDIETDASKIKMSGFSGDESGFTAITENSTVTEAIEAIEDAFLDNEYAISTALNDLNTRISGATGDVSTLSGEVQTISGNVDTISGNVNTVSGDVETLKTNYISGVTVNGTQVTNSSHIAPIVISAATSATTASTSNAIVVETDPNTGNITLGLNYIDCGTY